jgi:hypothetical protein
MIKIIKEKTELLIILLKIVWVSGSPEKALKNLRELQKKWQEIGL